MAVKTDIHHRAEIESREASGFHGERYAYKVLFGTPVRTRHCETFCFSFERLLKAAEDCDEDDMIKDSILGSAHGHIYKRILALRDNPPEGFVLGVYNFDPDTRD